jgi:hypothetical protein
MPRRSLECLLTQDFDTLTMWEQFRLLSAMLHADDTYRPFHVLFKREIPLCGARCWDGHPCQARCPFHKFAASHAAARLYGLGG